MMITEEATLIGTKHFVGATIVAGALRIGTIAIGVFAAATGSTLVLVSIRRHRRQQAATMTDTAFGILTDTTTSTTGGLTGIEVGLA
jgi:hypothetical protein